MSRLTKLACAALIALTLGGAATNAPVQQLAGDPSQWGIERVATSGSFDSTAFGGSEELLAHASDSGGTGKGGDVPVTPG